MAMARAVLGDRGGRGQASQTEKCRTEQEENVGSTGSSSTRVYQQGEGTEGMPAVEEQGIKGGHPTVLVCFGDGMNSSKFIGIGIEAREQGKKKKLSKEPTGNRS